MQSELAASPTVEDTSQFLTTSSGRSLRALGASGGELIAALLAGRALAEGAVVSLPLWGCPQCGGGGDALLRVRSLGAPSPLRLCDNHSDGAPLAPADTPAPPLPAPLARALARALHAPSPPCCPRSRARVRATGILLAGSYSAGELRGVDAVAAAAGVPVVRIAGHDVLGHALVGGSEARLSLLVSDARGAALLHGSCVVLLEEADALLPRRPVTDAAASCCRVLLDAMDECSASLPAASGAGAGAALVWVAVTSRPQDISPAALGPSRFTTILDGSRSLAPAPRTTPHHGAESPCPPGAAVGVSPPTTSWPESPLVGGSPPRPIPLSALVGCDHARRAAIAAVLAPLIAPHAFEALHTPPPSGLLIHGPPGTGKSMLAHALAYTAHSQGLARTLVITGPDIISPRMGASEAALAAAFAHARAVAPCILVIDQIECLAPARGGDGGLHGDRLLSHLLAELDGITTSSSASGGARGGRVCLIAVTRDADALDAALLRPGRLDARVATALPDEGERRALLEAALTPQSAAAPGRDHQGSAAGAIAVGSHGAPPLVTTSASWPALCDRAVAATRGASHAAICAMVTRAGMRALRRAVTGGEAPVVLAADVEEELPKSS